MRFARVLLLLVLAGCVTAPQQSAVPPLFVFQSNMWVNLHHFLRSAARGLPVSTEQLTADEQKIWSEAVAFYKANYANRHLHFDDGMVAIKEALRKIPTAEPLTNAAIDPKLREVLERAGPVYRHHWWPKHDDWARDWIVAAQPLVDKYGARLSRLVPAAYGEAWFAAPVPVDLSVEAGPVGAYTTSNPTASTISSTDPSYRGHAALEMLFHEPSHAFGRNLQRLVNEAAARHGKKVPDQLWHAVLFYNAGELTRRVLAEDGIQYVPYAQKDDLFKVLCGEGCGERVAAAWNRRLDGQATYEQAIDALVASTP